MITRTEIQAPVCTDDYGEDYYICCNTGQLSKASHCTFFGPFIAGVLVKYVGLKDSVMQRQINRKSFDASEANCNTCSHLSRVNHPKNPAGFLEGICTNPNGEPTPYQTTDGRIKFHPDDPMHMDCCKERDSK